MGRGRDGAEPVGEVPAGERGGGRGHQGREVGAAGGWVREEDAGAGDGGEEGNSGRGEEAGEGDGGCDCEGGDEGGWVEHGEGCCERVGKAEETEEADVRGWAACGEGGDIATDGIGPKSAVIMIELLVFANSRYLLAQAPECAYLACSSSRIPISLFTVP